VETVGRVNRALTTGSYWSGDVDKVGADDLDVFAADPRELEHQPSTQRDRPYFELLVVEKMSEAQSGRCATRCKWGRADDEFVYELVVAFSGDEALIAARALAFAIVKGRDR
jgi:arginine decarboxylase